MKPNILFLFLLICLVACKPDQEKTAIARQGDDSTWNDTIKVIVQGDVQYDNYFTGKTMRLDYNHSGNAKEERFATDRIVSDGPWPGSRTVMIDKLEYGLYFFQVIEEKTGILLYSRGFASIFGEWQTTGEAEKQWGSFHESIRFPWPKVPVIMILKKRDLASNQFKTLWIEKIDPASREVNPAELTHRNVVDVLYDQGPASSKVDVVILGDGYTKAEMGKFKKDAKRLADVLLSNEPFAARKGDISIRAIETPSDEPGVCKPHPGVFKRTPLSVQYGAFGSERYALTFDNKMVRNVASQVPYDFMVILVNERTYGGGGIYNLYTTVSADNKFADYIMVHEFGHHMAGLADEYYTSSVSYEAPDITIEPWEPNITALLDKEKLKWKDLVTPGTPLPTPWNKEKFDDFGYQIQKQRDSLRKAKVPEEVMEALFTRQMQQEDDFFAKDQYKDAIGAFEGAGYTPKGLYRSQLDCIMFTRHIRFCKVCARAMNMVMDQYTK